MSTLLTPEEIKKAVKRWTDKDWAIHTISLNRGHWEDIAPILACAQLAKVIGEIEKFGSPLGITFGAHMAEWLEAVKKEIKIQLVAR